MKKTALIVSLSIAITMGAPAKNRIKTTLRKNAKTCSKVAITSLYKTLKYLYQNSDAVLSKKTLTSIAVIGAPFFYFYPEALSKISEKAGGIVLRTNALIAEGLIIGIAKQPKALSKIAAILITKELGASVTKKASDLTATALVAIIKAALTR